ncbi:MAG: exodeoxyribonuclease III [Myxococcales bacterium]|nr:exodeoxyribonuclease III [Myxococcales bacterium]
MRACVRKGSFSRWLQRSSAAIVGLQEVRATAAQLPPDAVPQGWHAHFSSAEQAGYSGVGMLSRVEPDEVRTELGEPCFDREARVQLARFGRLRVANIYFPNGNGTDRDNSRVPYKLDFYRAVFDVVQRRRRAGYRVLVMGDFNTAHQEIDLARPRENKKNSGFLPEEREELDRWLQAGWIDTFRRQQPEPGHYSWWSQRGGARERNVGWRIDYVLASPNVEPFLRDAFIQREVGGSDHAPVGVELDRRVLD